MQVLEDVSEPPGTAAQARYEHEVAALDLSEAAQAVAQAASLAERASINEIQRLDALAARLYESADRHRELARCLEPQTRLSGAPNPVGVGIGGLEREPVPGRVGVGGDGAADGVEGAVEEHRLDADVVLEPLEVAQVGRRGGDSVISPNRDTSAGRRSTAPAARILRN